MTIVYTNAQHVSELVCGTATALGNFDGVHRGHAYLLNLLRQKCPDRPLSVVTFEPHPRQLFSSEKATFRLTNAEERNAALSNLGVDYIYQIDFNKEFATLSARQFIHRILHDKFGVTHIACGQGFVFGRNRQGNTNHLITEARPLGIGVTIIDPMQDDQGIISSSRIRQLLKDGKPEQAAALLGRPWTIQNEVQHGDQRGRTIGFPTANLSLGDQLEPKCGVYAVKVILPHQKIYAGVANIGYRPTIGQQNKACLEVHLFDFAQKIYGQKITVALHHFIREEKRFKNLNELKEQIARDITKAKSFLMSMHASVDS